MSRVEYLTCIYINFFLESFFFVFLFFIHVLHDFGTNCAGMLRNFRNKGIIMILERGLCACISDSFPVLPFVYVDDFSRSIMFSGICSKMTLRNWPHLLLLIWNRCNACKYRSRLFNRWSLFSGICTSIKLIICTRTFLHGYLGLNVCE